MTTTPISNEKASSIIKSKPVVAASVYSNLEPQLKAFAFTISGIESVDIMRTIRDTLAELPQGRNWKDVKADVAELLRQAFPEDKVMRRAELLLRTHGLKAYQVGTYESAQRTKALLPYFKYIATPDSKVRPSHKALHGLVLPVDHPFWDDHMPPWDWGCRCQVVQVSQDDYDDQKEMEKKIPYENRRILDNAQEASLMREDRVWTSPSSYINTRPVREKGSNPKSLVMDSVSVLKRFKSDSDKKEFLSKIEKIDLPEYSSKYTVRDWFEGKPMPELKSPTPRPLTDAIRITDKLSPSIREAFNNASELIWKTHDACTLSKCTLYNNERNSQGSYDKKNVAISINPNAKNPVGTLLHEVGHFISHKAIGNRDTMAASTEPRLKKLMTAIEDSSRVAALKLLKDIKIKGDNTNYDYLLDKEELFARAYAQYILTKTGQKQYLRSPWQDWPEKEFEKISKEFDNLFKSLKWRVS